MRKKSDLWLALKRWQDNLFVPYAKCSGEKQIVADGCDDTASEQQAVNHGIEGLTANRDPAEHWDSKPANIHQHQLFNLKRCSTESSAHA